LFVYGSIIFGDRLLVGGPVCPVIGHSSGDGWPEREIPCECDGGEETHEEGEGDGGGGEFSGWFDCGERLVGIDIAGHAAR